MAPPNIRRVQTGWIESKFNGRVGGGVCSADFCSWLEGLDYSSVIRTSEWLFPTIETVHVLALTTVAGSIAMLDLRLLGITSRDRPVSQVAADILPWTWSGFLLAALSGFLMF